MIPKTHQGLSRSSTDLLVGVQRLPDRSERFSEQVLLLAGRRAPTAATGGESGAACRAERRGGRSRLAAAVRIARSCAPCTTVPSVPAQRDPLRTKAARRSQPARRARNSPCSAPAVGGRGWVHAPSVPYDVCTARGAPAASRLVAARCWAFLPSEMRAALAQTDPPSPPLPLARRLRGMPRGPALTRAGIGCAATARPAGGSPVPGRCWPLAGQHGIRQVRRVGNGKRCAHSSAHVALTSAGRRWQQ